MNNIFETHITNTQKRLKKYNNMILKSKFDKKISDDLIQAYIDARYYNYEVDSSIKVFYRRIYDAVKNKAEEIIKDDVNKTAIVEAHLDLYQYYFYLDFVRKNPDIEQIVQSIVEMRLFKLNLRSAIDDNFKDEFTKIILDDMEEVRQELKKYESTDFTLNLKKASPKNNDYYIVRLNYHFDFPKLFSKEAIEEVFSTDIIGEDRLFVEYPMISCVALQDILDGNFNKKYICDFATSLFSKKKKLDQVIPIINNEAAQEKILFKISYDQFKEFKKDIFGLIKIGYRFALYTNDEMPKLTNEAIKLMEIFSCILVDKDDVNRNKYKNVNKIII